MQTSGEILVDYIYISASNTSNGQATFRILWSQNMYELKLEESEDGK